MNANTAAESQAIAGSLPQYTQLSEGDPYFFDFQAKAANQELYESTKARYFEKYPDFAKLAEEMEIVFQTFRAEYDRLINLAVGFLRSAEMSDFSRWNEVTAQTWNRIVFTHHRVPQEFYDRLLRIGNQVHSEYFEATPLNPSIISRQTEHRSSVDIISEYERIDVSRRQLQEILIPLGLRALYQKKPWGKNFPIEPIIRQIAYVMGMKDGDEEEFEETADEIIRINPSLFFAGFEEAGDLIMQLDQQNYVEIIRVLQTTKSKVKGATERLGRLQDPEFEAFRPFYGHLATVFFAKHDFKTTRVPYNRKNYTALSQLFQKELGLTQARVRTEVARLTQQDIQEINAVIT